MGTKQAPDPTGLFKVKLHYNGEKEEQAYHNGDVHTMWCCHPDNFSINSVEEVVKDLGLDGDLRYWWRFPDKQYSEGLRLLRGEVDNYEMALTGSDVGEIEMSIEHVIDQVPS